MKTQLVLLLTIFVHTATAKDYYVSNSGNDANNGTSSSTPWKTIDKVNSSSFSAGDNIFFKRGDTFYGKILASTNGVAGNPITYSDYGTGTDPKPVFTGFQTVSGWTSLGSNIWESTSAVSTLPYTRVVLINGSIAPIGRTPNADASYPYLPNYYPFQSITGTGSGASSITSSSISGTPDYTGAEVCVRVNQWSINRSTITSQSGGTFNYSGAGPGLTAGWGFFIQNSALTLDQQNEWYYNPSTKKLRIYSTSAPSNVQVSTIDTLAYFYSNSATTKYVAFDNISFTGANENSIWVEGNIGFTVSNCNISYSGYEGLKIYGGGVVSGNIANNTFYNNGSSALANNGTVSNLTITGNSSNMAGVISVFKPSDYANGSFEINAPYSLIQYNTIDSSAYCGINFNGDSVKVLNNFINHSAIVRGDAAGIYSGYAGNPGKIIDHNIVLNTIGNPRGTDDNSYFCFGIYSDDLGNNMTITNNTVINARTGGILLHSSNFMTVRKNTFYNCGSLYSGDVTWDNGGIAIDAPAGPYIGTMHDNTVSNNISVAVTPYQHALNYYADPASNGDINHFGILDSNFYIKVNYPSTVVNSYQLGSNSEMSLPSWKSFSSADTYSVLSASSVTSTDSIMIVYNPNNYDSTVALPYKYADVKGSLYNGLITLPGYESAVLIYNSALGPVITPGNAVKLYGNWKVK